ncbi:MAG: cupredoxin domain-containing protein [Candidatus Limnocylindria bacterium]
MIALGVGALALSLVIGRLLPPAATDVTAVQVHASMGGFDPATLSVKAGETFKVEFSSMDTPFHSDGGGWHQFAIDELGIDWKVGPESSEVFEFTAPARPGTFVFYCDICCGGKENPSMRGELTVTA